MATFSAQSCGWWEARTTKKPFRQQRVGRVRAGEGNRTLIASLEGWSFTSKLHPQYN